VTLEELDEALPNGLHDARIARILLNYEEATVKLDVEILVGSPDEPKSDTYRNATVTFSKVLFSVVQMPENERIFGITGSIWFIFQRLAREQLAAKVAKAIPDNALCYSLYVLEWEACINLAAMEASFEWMTH